MDPETSVLEAARGDAAGLELAADEISVMDVSDDWAVACDVQQRFMQPTGPVVNALSYAARCRQVHALGGDCYDFLPLSQGRLSFAIGDASGKGLAAALMIANVQSSVRTAAYFAGDDASGVLAAVNRQVHASSLAERYATLFYGVFDAASYTLSYVNAGHNPPLVLRRDGLIVSLDTGGLPLGLLAESNYEKGKMKLEPGDLILAYTDGITEAVSPEGEEWGTAGLQRAAMEAPEAYRESPSEILEHIFISLDNFSQTRQRDDATLVVLRVN